MIQSLLIIVHSNRFVVCVVCTAVSSSYAYGYLTDLFAKTMRCACTFHSVDVNAKKVWFQMTISDPGGISRDL